MKLLPIYEQLMKRTLSESLLKQISLDNVINLSQIEDVKDVGEWLHKDIKDIKYYYKDEPFEMFKSTAIEMEGTYDEFTDERERTKKIYKLLVDGNKPKPIFVELNDVNKFIMEGRHRIVAFMWYGLDEIPVIYVN